MSPSDPRFVLHVGAHVTGARQVQRYLRENPEQLHQQGLRYFPREAMATCVGSGSKLVADPGRFAHEVRRVLERPGIHGFLASHENTLGQAFTDAGGLYTGGGPTLEALAEVAKPYRCTIVLSVSPQADFLESYYLQRVNHGEWDTFDTWLARCDLDAISWLPLHEQLVGTFGADAVRVLDYRKVRADPESCVREFCRLTDIDLPTDLRVSPVHTFRHSDKGLRVSLAANPYLRTYDERAGLRNFLEKHFSDRDYPPVRLLSEEQRRSLDDRYGDEYWRLVSNGPVEDAVPSLGHDAGEGARP